MTVPVTCVREIEVRLPSKMLTSNLWHRSGWISSRRNCSEAVFLAVIVFICNVIPKYSQCLTLFKVPPQQLEIQADFSQEL